MVILRSVPGWRPPTRITKWAPSGPTTITAHYFGVDIKLNTLEDLFKVWLSVQANDMDAKGYSDIMYNLGLSPFSSDVYLLRGLNNRNAANGSTFSNQASISVLVPLGPKLTLFNNLPTAAGNLFGGAVNADAAIGTKFRNLGWLSHSDWKPTGCCGDWMRSQLKEIDMHRPTPMPVSVFEPNPDYTKRPWLKVGSTDRSAALDADISYEGDGYVSFLQRVLNGGAGQNIGVDGIFGGGEGTSYSNTTESAVKNVQRVFGLTPDGIVFPDTWGAIHWIATVNNVH